MSSKPRNLVLRCGFTLGDVVLLTAAVRDLHQYIPGAYSTDVRTGFPELWAHNPYLSQIDEYASDVRVIDCGMPLVNRSDQAGRHAIHGFTEFLSETLGIPIALTQFKGDIHLSQEERRGISPVEERTGQRFPYWLINAGGKHDCTAKWWDPERFQNVVDHFQGQIQFVQVGCIEHWHPPLRGVIDFKGRTNVRELVRLVHHADGVLCGVTALMHLAAAVPLHPRHGGIRPCVVVAGGREPPPWEAYSGHQYIHTVGALSCCASTGCWKSRTRPLGDGKDAPDQLCVNVRGQLPACMDMITADEVIRRIDLYLAGGSARLLSPAESDQAARALKWSGQQTALALPVTFYNAPRAAADFISRIPPFPNLFKGRGIVICGGGVRMFANAWVCIRMLRKLGCELPVELWHLGKFEMDSAMEELVRPWGVTCVDATDQNVAWSAKVNSGWPLKPYAIINSSFEEVLMLDADNVPVRNPEFLFEHPLFREHGAVLWPDRGRLPVNSTAWRLFDVAYRDEPEIESGQILVNKQRCWGPLLLCMWYNEQNHLFYKHVHGDKETFHFAFRRLDVPYAITQHPMVPSQEVLYQHDFDGARLFQHRNGDKWNLFGSNRSIPGFLHEGECQQFLTGLAEKWDGQLAWLKETKSKTVAVDLATTTQQLKLAVAMASCAERESLRIETLQRLSALGWPAEKVLIALDERRFASKVDNLTHTAWRALRQALDSGADYLLYLEDDLDFNRHLFENLRRWEPLAERELHIGNLCNLGHRELAWNVTGRAYLVHPKDVLGSQAVLLSRQMLRRCLERWREGPPDLDLKLGFIAAEARQPSFFHCPSLVQHIGRRSLLDHDFRAAVDFDSEWHSNLQPAFELVITHLF
jgi:ADP-heptose:LPS heptosyltransferase